MAKSRDAVQRDMQRSAPRERSKRSRSVKGPDEQPVARGALLRRVSLREVATCPHMRDNVRARVLEAQAQRLRLERGMVRKKVMERGDARVNDG
jgi:hypothetical protein